MSRLLWVVFILLATGSCKEKEPDPVENTETCYDKMPGTYVVNAGTPNEYEVRIERYDTSANEVYFKIANLNQMFDLVNKQFCKFPEYNLVYGPSEGSDYAVDNKGNRYYIFQYDGGYDEKQEILHLTYRIVNIKFYGEDGAPYLDTTVTQDLYKRK